MMNGNMSGMVKQAMMDPQQASSAGDPAQDEMLMRVLASSKGIPAGQPQQSLNPYEAGLREDPANMGNKGRIEGGLDRNLQQIIMQELSRQMPDATVTADPAPRGLPTQYPQQVKQPQLRR